MKKRLFIIGVLILLLSSLPVSAFEPKDIYSYGETPLAIAWWEDNEIYVALANESSSRQSYTVEVYDTQRNTVLDRIETFVPSKTILVETLKPRTTGKASFPIEEVTIYSGYRGRTIRIQEHEWFTVDNYLVPLNTNIEVAVDLTGIRGNGRSGRLIVDNEYTLSNTSRAGQITVKYDPGISYTHRNIIEYRPAYLTLSMRTPYVSGVNILSFGLSHSLQGSWRSDYIYGPVFMVYGNDMRVIDGYYQPQPDRVTR